MSRRKIVVLPESLETNDFVEHDVFTDVTQDGEIYTSYRIVRVTHAIVDDPQGWNFVANVVGIAKNRLGVAELKIVDRLITESRISLTPQ